MAITFSFPRATLLSYLVVSVLSQFVPAPTDLTTVTGYGQSVRYKEVPEGICELTPGVKSYSGYVDIAENEHIFFWFFEARNQDPTTAPLTVWINGGPGSSSMIGLFQELGPCMIDEKMNVVYNPYAWNNASNMIFIDQPATTGFSYSVPVSGYYSELGGTEYLIELGNTTCPPYAHGGCGTYSKEDLADVTDSTISSRHNFWLVLQGFIGAFPQYSQNGFHFTSESYGGHYGPVYNEYFLEQNAAIAAGNLPGAQTIDLQSVMIGNGWYDPLIQYQAYYNYTVYPGNTYDYSPYTEEVQKRIYNALYGAGNCYDQTVECYTTGRNDICSTADSFCASQIEYPLDVVGRDEYDIRELAPDPFPYSYYVEYLNTPAVQQAVGAFVNFSESSDTVYYAFSNTGDDDRTQGSPASVKKLVEQGIYFVMYNGDADYNCNWLGNQVVADNIEAPGFSSAGFENVSTSDGVVHGQVKQSDTFAFVRVYESGHEVPFYQPEIALSMFERVIGGLDVATGEARIAQSGGYATMGDAVSTYREGNSTVQFKVTPAGSTYNTTTNEPDPPAKGMKKRRSEKMKKHKRSLVPRARP